MRYYQQPFEVAVRNFNTSRNLFNSDVYPFDNFTGIGNGCASMNGVIRCFIALMEYSCTMNLLFLA